MADAFRDRMKEVCSRMLEEEFTSCGSKKAESEGTVPTLDNSILPIWKQDRKAAGKSEEERLEKLAEKITAFLPEDQSLLYFHYCFHIPDQKAGEILGISRPVEQRIYIERVLSAFEHEERAAVRLVINKTVMEKACKKALADYTAYNQTEAAGFPAYSNKFRRKLKKIRAAQKTQSPILIFARQAAVFLLVLTLGFSGAMVTNAEFRERVVEWLVETFPEFTRFRLSHIGQRSASDVEKEIKAYTITYIPEGFRLENVFDGKISLIYTYTNENNEEIIISIMSENSVSSYDTERATVRAYELEGKTVYYWEKDNLHYAVWLRGNVKFNIISKLELDEVVKIVKNIKN